MVKRAAIVVLLILLSSQVYADIVVDIPLDQQINIGLGDAISSHSSFISDPDGGFVRKLLTVGNGAGGWYWGPEIDLVKAGYGPYVDLTVPGTTIQYTARYFQGDGNTNPYGDAPIFIQLTDSSGKRGGLGISYGPRPSPIYPSWITCTDDMTVGDYPTDAGFDLSKVIKIGFFGTDWSGAGGDFLDIKNLKITNPLTHNTISIAEAKTKQDGTEVEVRGEVSASMSLNSQFYIQDPQRSCGIQIRSSTVPSAGASVYVSGTVETDPVTAEMYIQAASWSHAGSGTARPLCLNARALGGKASARQAGVYTGEGLNNIGLLVSLYGKVTAAAPDMSHFYIFDGYELNDGSGYQGVRIDLSSVQPMQRPVINVNDRVTVAGVSAVYQAADGNHHRMIRAGEIPRIVNLDDDGNRPKTIKVMVINFDPIIEYKGNKRLHAVYWPTHSPQTMAEYYINDLKECSGNWANYEIVEWVDADYFPIKTDGFQYTDESFCTAWENGGPFHSPDGVDYFKVVRDKYYSYNNPRTVVERIASGEIDEVFMFGAPYFGYWESCMMGPSPYFVNGGTYYVPEAGRNFIVMGFNYERWIGEMLEDYGHRTESIMRRVYGSWNGYPPQHNWDKFTLYDKIAPGNAACGNVHFAPNSTADYQWGNSTYVWSTCDDWLLNWPDMQGTKKWVNRTEWGGGDIRLHHKWWLKHLPRKPGINPDGKQNNWWKYVADFNSYPESR